MKHEEKIAHELGVKTHQVQATVQLLDDGATVPFISRYRKEVTGSLDDVQVTAIRDRIQQLRDLHTRSEAILKSIREQEKLTPDLENKIMKAETMSILEDLYLPYRPKRKTRASVAMEKGLEPLAVMLLKQTNIDISLEAANYIDEPKGVMSEEDALQGARDIIAEMINEDAESRQKIRDLFMRKSTVSSRVIKGKEEQAAKYKDYFEWDESIAKIPSHRLLAIRRGEKELFLSLTIEPNEEEAIQILSQQFLIARNEASKQIEIALKDSYKRLMKVSIETEVRMATKKKADEEAIRVFAENLKQLLMGAPLGQKAVMAIDPGFRTGCKVVCLDKQGKLLEFIAIYPNEPRKDISRSGEAVKRLVEKHQIEAIAIGNGTAGRETEKFVKDLDLSKDIIVAMVNENGASIYSASEVAREEFPNEDVTVRGAVSIGRRMVDPLAELVKIDAKSIGVGQYQHDVDQNALKQSLDDVVMGCVNNVGVELNTASKQLLTYVSGLGPQIAGNIVKYRNENGPFKSREALKKVPRLGDKAFEQAAGFLRINDAKNPLDMSAVHPERYETVALMARDAKATIQDLINRQELRKQINLNQYVSNEVGLPTLKDILAELDRPGRDPRDQFEVVAFAEGVNEITDLKVNMSLTGIVTNITKFGAFVDIGVHQDGLVHISHLSNSFVADPTQVVKLGQKVTVRVMEVDIPRKRISLSMKTEAPQVKRSEKRKQKLESKSKLKENPNPDGDLQASLAMLKGKFGS
ncbi:MAG: Tex family protein [Bacteroidetes bacterium]|nr:Tex family protein [Bacteroidota bacterium]MDA1121154.1 Tex family protein [Bacteroidota bacterium]